MLRYSLRIVLAIAVVGIYATTASAGNLNLVDNGDIELESRFAPHGTPGVDSVQGFADAWHHSGTADGMWSDPNTQPFVSADHSLWLDDDPNKGGLTFEAEARSFAGDSGCCGGGGAHTGNLPLVGVAGRVLEVSWEWDYTITSDPNHVFTATIRTSEIVGTGLDLVPDDPNGPGTFTEYFFFSGTGTSGGFVSESVSIPLAAAVAQWDIIFNTGDRTAPDFGGRLNATGVLFVDDVSARIPEPASLLLLSISGLMVMGRRRRS